MSAELRPGGLLGPYRIDGEIGRGGMGVVYRATDTRMDRRVALKVIAPDLAADPDFRARFQRESRVAATLEHPHIVPVYEAGHLDGQLFMAMRFIEGADLAAVVRDGGPLAPERVARVVSQLAGALDAAHRAGMVHRDVKPANALLSGRGHDEHAFLSDFGLTRDASSQSALTRTGEWIGTVDYAAPEQIQGRHIDARSDVYAFGCVIFHALTGRAPFTGPPAAKLFGHVSGPIPSARELRPAIPIGVDDVLQRALAKDPSDRFPSAGDLGRALAASVAGVQNEEPEQTVATGPALTGIPAAGEAETAAQATEVLPASTRVKPLEPLEPRQRDDHEHRRQGAPPAGGRPGQRRSRRFATLALAAIVLFACGAAAVVAAGQFGDGADDDARAAKGARAEETATPAVVAATPKPKRKPQRSGKDKKPSEKPESQRAQPEEDVPASSKAGGSSVSYAPYSPDSSSFTAELPAGGGWSVVGERELNPGLLRTTVDGPDGATIWIDVTPAEPPGFSTDSVEVISDTRLAGGIREIVFSGGGPDFCEADACVDYQLDLGDSGIAVLGGPGVQARAVARRVATSLEPQL
jgi:hypothetical protein